MNKKLLAMGLSVTMIAGMLTGCGSSSTESGDSTASTSQTQSEVTEHLKYHRQQLLMTNQLL